MSPPLIGRFEHLPNRPKSDEARPLLEKIASQVKPIMTKRSWKVGTLAEFLPSNPALLGNNMNHGERINLRLRPPGSPSTFYEYDQLVLVMLHELTHIAHGPHNAQFYKLLAELEEEYYELKRKGYSGEGFHSAGNSLSGRWVNEYQGRAVGLAAAEKRLAMQRKIGKGGVLGGSNVKGRSMKEVLAEAAERRIRDDKACHTVDAGGSKEVEEEVKRAQEESVGVDARDLSSGSDEGGTKDQAAITERDEDEGEVAVVAGPSRSEKSTSSIASQSRSSRIPKPSQSTLPDAPESRPALLTRKGPTMMDHAPPALGATQSPVEATKLASRPSQADTLVLLSGEWQCPTCTLLNLPHILRCEACTSPKPVSVSSKDGKGWMCEFCGSGPRDMSFWSCGECGWVRKWG